jgi:hypothetical protein
MAMKARKPGPHAQSLRVKASVGTEDPDMAVGVEQASK